MDAIIDCLTRLVVLLVFMLIGVLVMSALPYAAYHLLIWLSFSMFILKVAIGLLLLAVIFLPSVMLMMVGMQIILFGAVIAVK